MEERKVWTITYCGSPDDTDFPIAIFSTFELADAYVQKQYEPAFYGIDEWTVDKEPE